MYNFDFFIVLQTEESIATIKNRIKQPEPYIIFQDFKDGLVFSTIIIDGKDLHLGYVTSRRAFDVYFKTFYVFNLTYESTSKQLMNFFEVYVYAIKKVSPFQIAHKWFRTISISSD